MGEHLDGGGLDGGPEQVAQAQFVLNGFDGLAKSLGNLVEADFQGFQDGLLLSSDDAFLAELLSDSHGSGADIRLSDREKLTVERIFVNPGLDDVTDEPFESFTRDLDRQDSQIRTM